MLSACSASVSFYLYINTGDNLQGFYYMNILFVPWKFDLKVEYIHSIKYNLHDFYVYVVGPIMIHMTSL